MLLWDKADKIITLAIIITFIFKFGIILVFFAGFFIFRIVNETGAEFQYKKSVLLMFFILIFSGLKNSVRYFENKIDNPDTIKVFNFILG